MGVSGVNRTWCYMRTRRYWDLGYTSVLEKNLQRARFILNMESSGGWRLEEILKFNDQRSAMAHAEQRARQAEVSNGN